MIRFLAGLCFVYMTALMGFGIASTKSGSYLVRSNQQEVVFRQPSSRRIFALMLMGMFTFSLALITWAILTGYGVSTPTSWPERVLWLSIPYLISFGCLALLSRMAGPNEIRFQLQEGSYRYVRFWPWMAAPWIGPLADITGVGVVNRGSVYVTLVVWKRHHDVSTLLGQFTTREEANQLAQNISVKCGLPIVEPAQAYHLL